MDDEGQPVTASRLYLELTPLLIEREIAKFTNGEQAAHESFAHMAKLVSNAKEELAASCARAHGRPAADRRGRSSKRHGRGTSVYGQAAEF
jgi:hypothetical protein